MPGAVQAVRSKDKGRHRGSRRIHLVRKDGRTWGSGGAPGQGSRLRREPGRAGSDGSQGRSGRCRAGGDAAGEGAGAGSPPAGFHRSRRSSNRSRIASPAAWDGAIAGLKRGGGWNARKGPVAFATPDWLSPASAFAPAGDNVALPPIPPPPVAYRVPHPRMFSERFHLNLPTARFLISKSSSTPPNFWPLDSVHEIFHSACFDLFSRRTRCISVNFKKEHHGRRRGPWDATNSSAKLVVVCQGLLRWLITVRHSECVAGFPGAGPEERSTGSWGPYGQQTDLPCGKEGLQSASWLSWFGAS